MFSSRTPESLGPNALAQAIERARHAGRPLVDLTETNPTRAGFDYPWDRIGAALGAPHGLAYEPDPRGLATAREAVSAYYRERGVEAPSDRIVLTASTSEAYALLFKLLCEPGDEVLVPTPSYPLFEHLARAESVRAVPYRLEWTGSWRLDIESVRNAITAETRAIVTVSPNNPTGSTLKASEQLALVELCREHELALIADEVFADYCLTDDPFRAGSAATVDGALSFTLNGLSKIAGLPQVKLGWIVANGPSDVLAAALARLEFLADLYLSVGTPVQRALPDLFASGQAVRRQIRDRIAGNLAELQRIIGQESACSAFPIEGGWSALVRVPRLDGDERLAVRLVEEAGVIAQPGYFFDIEQEGVLVVSLLTEPGAFREGIERIVASSISRTD